LIEARLTFVALMLALVGCSTTGGVRQPSGPELVAADKALIMPPPGGPGIVGVVQQSHENGTEQTVSLTTVSRIPGQNYLKISFSGGRDAEQPTSTAYRPLGEATLRTEMNAAAPGVQLTRSTLYLQNAYGPFGYASGHSRHGDVCIYGWQQLRSRSTGNGFGRDFGMIQVRLRLCDNRATENELLSVLYGYTIVGGFQGEIWNPYGSPAPIDPRLGQTGQPIYPTPDATARLAAFGYSAATPITTNSIRPVADRTVRASTAPHPTPAPANRVPAPGPEAGVITIPSPPADASVTGNSTSVVVPSPDCIGTTAIPAACSNKGGSKPSR
jgi:hypothetical protein